MPSLVWLVGFRLLNAFTLRTFFQPDEFFQSLEPAWRIAFGADSGSWITWEWRHHLRSSLHPIIFAAVYSLADALARILQLSPATRAELLIAGPKTAQAVIAAVGDYYTYKLARHIYGRGNEARATLALTLLSPWQWFCSTRTLSNCLETTITIVALYLWPWEWSLGSVFGPDNTFRGYRVGNGSTTRLRQCLCLAAVACILRPTNILLWMILASFALLRGSWTERTTLVREAAICGFVFQVKYSKQELTTSSTILAISAVSDRLFYGLWTFPPLRFLHFNIAQSLAVFYGRNDWHYYLSQGYPLLLTTALPFTVVGLYRSLFSTPNTTDRLQTRTQTQLGTICLVMPAVLSFISHKEVRFIYPLLPSLHILTAPILAEYFSPAIASSSRRHTPRRLTLLFLLLANITIGVYTTQTHNSGPLNVLTYLRHQHETHSPPPAPPRGSSSGIPQTEGKTNSPGITTAFLMPCHSTPWRSHLIHPTLHAWALSCEPPVDLSPAEKSTYLDEADEFYANPDEFLRLRMRGGRRGVPYRPSYYSSPPPPPPLSESADRVSRDRNRQSRDAERVGMHDWPDYLVFFAALEETMSTFLRATEYGECWRGFNSVWHDDWRRRGDVVVWCVDPAEKGAWERRKRMVNAGDEELGLGMGWTTWGVVKDWTARISKIWPVGPSEEEMRIERERALWS